MCVLIGLTQRTHQPGSFFQTAGHFSVLSRESKTSRFLFSHRDLETGEICFDDSISKVQHAGYKERHAWSVKLVRRLKKIYITKR